MCLVFLTAISFTLEGSTASPEWCYINCICYCPVNDMRWPACSLGLDWVNRKWSWLTLSHYLRIWEPWSAFSRTVDVLSKFANVTLQIQNWKVTCWASLTDWWSQSGYCDVNSMSQWPNPAHDADIPKFLCPGTLKSHSHTICHWFSVHNARQI
jgi:hypothetical protein